MPTAWEIAALRQLFEVVTDEQSSLESALLELLESNYSCLVPSAFAACLGISRYEPRILPLALKNIRTRVFMDTGYGDKLTEARVEQRLNVPNHGLSISVFPIKQNILHNFDVLKEFPSITPLELSLTNGRYHRVKVILKTTATGVHFVIFTNNANELSLVLNKVLAFLQYYQLTLNKDEYASEALNALTAKEYDLFTKLLSADDNTVFTNALTEYVRATNILEDIMRNRYIAQIKQWQQTRVKNLESHIQRAVSNIRDFERNILAQQELLIEHNRAMAGLLSQDGQVFVEGIFDAAKKFPAIQNISIDLENGNSQNLGISLCVVAPVKYYDTDVIKRSLDNPRSSISGWVDNVKGLRQLVEDIFVHQKYTLYCKSGFTMYLTQANIQYNRSHMDRSTRTNEILTKAIPNPHLQSYNCMGGHRDVICKAIEQVNFELAFAQLIASTANLSFDDLTVMQSFFTGSEYMQNGRIACLVDADGVYWTPQKLISKNAGGNE